MEPSRYRQDQWIEDYDWFSKNMGFGSTLLPEEFHTKLAEYFFSRYSDDAQIERRTRFFRAVSFLGQNMTAFDSRHVATVGRKGASISQILVLALWTHFVSIPLAEINDDPDPGTILGYAEYIRDHLDRTRPGWDK